MSGGSITSFAYRGLILNDSSTFNFSGGLITGDQPVQLYGTSTMNFSGGLITGHKGIELFESSSLTMTGGVLASDDPNHIHGMMVYDDSRVNISGTTARLDIDAINSYGTSRSVLDNVNFIQRVGAISYGSSHMILNDVTLMDEFGIISAYDSSEMVINGVVTTGVIQTRDSSKMTITESQMDLLGVWHNSEAEIIGYDFTTSGGLTLVDGRLFGEGILYGKWNNGTDLMFDVYVDETAFAHVAPEPGTLVLLAIGAASVIRRRRK